MNVKPVPVGNLTLGGADAPLLFVSRDDGGNGVAPIHEGIVCRGPGERQRQPGSEPDLDAQILRGYKF